MKEVRFLANGLVGNGFSYKGFQAGLACRPDMIGCDAGTSDYGPGPLGGGRDTKPPESVKRDLSIMLRGARQLGVPLIIGSCGVAGAAPHLEGYRRIVEEISLEDGLSFRMALIYADQDRQALRTALAQGRIDGLGPVAPLDDAAIEASSHIVGMAGAAPFMKALDGGADVILAGRCTDPAIYAGVGLRAGLPPGPVWHAARSVDKGSLATTDVGEGSPVLATVTENGFIIEPTKEGAACTVKTIAALTMYENPDPWTIRQPSGAISAEHCRFEQLDHRRVRVTGSTFEPSERITIKLEGARRIGFRQAFLVGIRDPRLIAGLDDYLARYRALITRLAASVGVKADQFTLRYLVYGRDAVMGAQEPLRERVPHEIGLLVDVVADTAANARAVITRASAAGSKLDPVKGIPAGGNFAAPFSPNFLDIGEVYEWSAWHLMTVEDECDPFRIEFADVG